MGEARLVIGLARSRASTKIRNPKSEMRKKSEYRNPKSERSPKLEIRSPKEVRSPKPEKKARIRWLLVGLELPTASGCPVCEFGTRNSELGFLSDFGFRISD